VGTSEPIGAKKFVPVIVTIVDAVTLYSTVAGLTLVIVGTGANTVNASARVALPPPAAAGFVTVTVYAPGVRSAFGHHTLTRVAATCTNGTAAVALLPLTVTSVRLVAVVGLAIVTVAPNTKFVPVIASARLVVTPYVTDAGSTLLSVGAAATTVNPPARVTLSPPAAVGLVTVTSYAPGANAVFAHQKYSRVAL
jgi:hypothetical protein